MVRFILQGYMPKPGTFLLFLFMKQSLSRERFCQAQDSHFSSSLTTEDVFNYAIVEAVGYEFKTIQLNQLVRRVLSCFDPKKFSVAVHQTVGVNTYKPEISVYLEDQRCRERKSKSLGEESGPVMYHTDMIQGTWEGAGTCTIRRREGSYFQEKSINKREDCY